MSIYFIQEKNTDRVLSKEYRGESSGVWYDSEHQSYFSGVPSSLLIFFDREEAQKELDKILLIKSIEDGTYEDTLEVNGNVVQQDRSFMRMKHDVEHHYIFNTVKCDQLEIVEYSKT